MAASISNVVFSGGTGSMALALAAAVCHHLHWHITLSIYNDRYLLLRALVCARNTSGRILLPIVRVGCGKVPCSGIRRVVSILGELVIGTVGRVM